MTHTTICAWCDVVLRQGDSPLPSHGICPSCRARVMDEWHATRPARPAARSASVNWRRVFAIALFTLLVCNSGFVQQWYPARPCNPHVVASCEPR